jgi:hypothetical protein
MKAMDGEVLISVDPHKASSTLAALLALRRKKGAQDDFRALRLIAIRAVAAVGEPFEPHQIRRHG